MTAREQVVINTGPLIALSRGEALPLLGQLPRMRPIVDAMRARGIWYSNKLVDTVLKAVGE